MRELPDVPPPMVIASGVVFVLDCLLSPVSQQRHTFMKEPLRDKWLIDNGLVEYTDMSGQCCWFDVTERGERYHELVLVWFSLMKQDEP